MSRETDDVPVHVQGTVPAVPPSYTTVATFPPGTFLENLAVRRDGSILVSDMLSGCLWSVNPHASNPQSVELLHKFEQGPTEPQGESGSDSKSEGSYSSAAAAEMIVESPEVPDLFYVTSGVHGNSGTWSVHELDLRVVRTDKAKVTRLADIPAATWLNGGTAVPTTDEVLILMAESYQGRIYAYGVRSGVVSVWLEHPLLGKVTARPPWPGVNGIKYHRQADGRTFVYFTCSDRAVLGRVRVDTTTGKPALGSREEVDISVLATGCAGDDLCLDHHDNIYVATNPMDTLLKFPPAPSSPPSEPEPERTVLLGLRHPPGGQVQVDPETTGPTAVALGRTPSDVHDLYVVTNGGIINPLDGVVREAKVIRVHRAGI